MPGNDGNNGAAPQQGDYVEVTTGDGKRSAGTLMPHHDFSAGGIIILKLDSGYNIGIKSDDNTAIRVLRRRSVRPGAPASAERGSAQGSGLPAISVLSTGGTIASFVEYETGAVHPALTADCLLGQVPELREFCSPRAKVLYSILSEDMKPQNWAETAKAAADELNSGSRGVVIAHGTDTMGYTAAALSFMLQNLTGPVVLVGSQRSSDRPSSDASGNLIAAARLAAEGNLGEVAIIMHSGTSDDSYAVHRGTRARKMHTSRRDAFRSVNAPLLGSADSKSFSLDEPYAKRAEGKVTVKPSIEPNIALVQFYPGMTAAAFERAVGDSKGVVIAGTGLGHVSSDLIPIVANVTGRGVAVVMASQCISGAVNMNVYQSGRKLRKAGAIPAGDMLPETALVKLMWALGQTADMKEVARLMQKNLAGELSEEKGLSLKEDA